MNIADQLTLGILLILVTLTTYICIYNYFLSNPVSSSKPVYIRIKYFLNLCFNKTLV